jgi:hypothetical protein
MITSTEQDRQEAEFILCFIIASAIFAVVDQNKAPNTAAEIQRFLRTLKHL